VQHRQAPPTASIHLLCSCTDLRSRAVGGEASTYRGGSDAAPVAEAAEQGIKLQAELGKQTGSEATGSRCTTQAATASSATWQFVTLYWQVVKVLTFALPWGSPSSFTAGAEILAARQVLSYRLGAARSGWRPSTGEHLYVGILLHWYIAGDRGGILRSRALLLSLTMAIYRSKFNYSPKTVACNAHGALYNFDLNHILRVITPRQISTF
jgi:hypothetical protein